MTSYGKINYINGSNIISTIAIYGLSTDTKPTVYGPYDTPIPNGSAFVEMDTSTMYLFDEANQEWDAWNPFEPAISNQTRATLVYRSNPSYNSLSELSDVYLEALETGQVLTFDESNGQWVNTSSWAEEVSVEGTNPVIEAMPNRRYVCGEVSTLSFTPSSSGICDVLFTSGSTPTVLTVPSTVLLPESFEILANRTYELNFANSYAVSASWPVA